uniref:Uncharacterized protein n=1 Tax=Mola mola TaxID=94237 RepID=A0A3Q3XDD6_MOLML
MGDVLCEELEDLVHFSVHDLPARGYVVMEEIRRQGKLCDVTLKVKTDDSCDDVRRSSSVAENENQNGLR